jgi:hypothetical protein
MEPGCPDLRPTMIYWTSSSGTIFRAESKHSDLVRPDDKLFCAPFISNSIVGHNLFQFIDGVEVRHLYKALADKVLKTGIPITFPYRCDGPKTRREMQMRLSLEGRMVKYESTVIRETPRERELPHQSPSGDNFVAICSFCQKYRFPVTSTIWNELERLLMERRLPAEFRFTHGICENCFTAVMSDPQ